MKPKTRKSYIALAALSLAVFVLLAALLAASAHRRRAERESTAEMKVLYTEAASDALGGESEAGESETDGEIPRRFQKLYEVNPELIGWLSAGGVIDEPVVYRDNSYYLHHSFTQAYSNSGTVFADEENESWYTDPYVVLYGHNIHGGDKFGALSSYKELDFVKENPFIEWDSVRSPGAERYAVFAVFEASMLEEDEDYFHLRRFEQLSAGGEEEMQSLITEVQQGSALKIPLEVSPQDRILVLTTCSYSNADGRLLVFARALRADESAPQVALAVACAERR